MGRAALRVLAATTLVLDSGNCEAAATEISDALTEASSKPRYFPAAYLHVPICSSLATTSEFSPPQRQKPSLLSPRHL